MVYFCVQGGKYDNANTIYITPSLSLTQERSGIPFPNGKTYTWLFTLAWLFWTVGIGA